MNMKFKCATAAVSMVVLAGSAGVSATQTNGPVPEQNQSRREAITTKTLAAVRIENIAGRKVELLQIESPAPKAVVVFENGLRGTLDGWEKVVDALGPDMTVFAYNRAGNGKSEGTPNPRDGQHIIGELRATLQHQGLKPPYVLVGHSLGGLYMQLYARTYPQEVKGVVLVDSIFPGVIKKKEDFPLYTKMARQVFFSNTVNREIDGIHDTGNAVLALPWQHHIPMIRLINVPKSAGAIGVDFGVINSGPNLAAMVNGLYPEAKTVIVDSDHQIQSATPEAVVQAIRGVLHDGT
jgi:pimeloyl-ACP methyl ester carboxylesterase